MAVLSAAGTRGSITQCRILRSQRPKALCETASSSQTLPLLLGHGAAGQSRVPSPPIAQCHVKTLNATRAGPILEQASRKSRQLKATHCGSSYASPCQQLGVSPKQRLAQYHSLINSSLKRADSLLLAKACRGRALHPRGASGGAQTKTGSHKQCGLLGGSAFSGVPLARKCGLSPGRKGRQKGMGSAVDCWCSADLAANMFTFGTALVVPFYTLMLAAPKKRITRKVMDSALPYVILGAMYMYLLYISWTPEHPKLMFSSKYWLPELSGITRMFSSMLTVSSAWIHLLAVDLFAGRNIYLDSLTHNLPCRHSLVLCLMFGPVGIFSHLFTKNVVMAWRKATKTEKDNTAPEASPVDVFPNQPFAGPGSEAATEPVDGSEY